MSTESYAFETANKGTVTITITGECWDGTHDVEVEVADECEVFCETDDADAILEWLARQGVEFESKRSAVFNQMYIQSVMLDGDGTLDALVAEVGAMTDDEINGKYALHFDF